MHPVAVTLLSAVLLCGCTMESSRQTVATTLIDCGKPRPRVCTMEYLPVCAVLAAGGRENYASHCNACADDAVLAYEKEACGETE